ncbi:DMT family transporter [Kineothrix sp. MB12-C1]|uniref:DMT family transporter n=1 Tax=Kineothrix sp. MB12-C1 TaxID=3070215 RepID=UPI0027D2DC2B|nr:DMT family transporter [Kineothrix sp. MB12-C1]WMC91487.1 DMT family transporter [Kineothrix sp. MB12-C1]
MNAKVKLVIAMLIFGSIGIFVRTIDMPSGILALVRGSIGTVFLWLAGIAMKRKISSKAIKKNFKLLMFSGVAIGANWICLFEAYRYTTISVATLCYYLSPVFVILVSPIFLKEKLTAVKGGCVMLSLLGMMLVVDVFNGGYGNGSGIKGIAFGIMAALLYASVVIMNKFLKEIEPIDMTVSQLGIASVVLLPYILLTGSGSKVTINGSTLLLLLLLGIVNTGIAYLLYFSSLKDLSGQTAALFSYIDPVTAILLSALLFQEKMSVPQVLGAVLILGSTVVSELIENRKQASSGQVV